MTFRSLVLFLLAACLPAMLSAAEPPTPLKVLLITGGCCHDYTAQKRIVADGLEQRAYLAVTVVQQGGSATDSKIELYQNPDWAAGYDVVIHDECFAAVDDQAWVDRILAPHRAGTPAVVLHCAMHCYRTGADDWFAFCGVTSRRHGGKYPFTVVNGDAKHPVMQGFGNDWKTPAGELYWIERVWETTHPLASAANKETGKDDVCVWVNEYGPEKTRVFGTTIGHHNETVGSPEYLDLLTRGTLWAAGKLDASYLKPHAESVQQ